MAKKKTAAAKKGADSAPATDKPVAKETKPVAIQGTSRFGGAATFQKVEAGVVRVQFDPEVVVLVRGVGSACLKSAGGKEDVKRDIKEGAIAAFAPFHVRTFEASRRVLEIKLSGRAFEIAAVRLKRS